MKLVWLLAALLLTSLAIGGLMSATRQADIISVIGDVAISLFLGWAAIACWKRTSS